MRDDTSTYNGTFDQSIKLFVSSNSKLQMPWGDTFNLDIFVGISCQLLTSAVRYSRIAAEYTAAVAPTLPFADTLDFNRRWIGPTRNCNKNKQSSQHITGILWSSFLQEYLNCYKASMKMVLPVKSIPRITSVESRF